MSDFTLAFKLLKQGKMVKRTAVKNNTVIVNHKGKLYHMDINTGIRYSYHPTNIDLFAEDWIEWKSDKKQKPQ